MNANDMIVNARELCYEEIAAATAELDNLENSLTGSNQTVELARQMVSQIRGRKVNSIRDKHARKLGWKLMNS